MEKKNILLKFWWSFLFEVINCFEKFDPATMMTEVQTQNNIITLDSPNKKIKLNNEGIGNLKVDATDAYKEILQVEIRKREKVSMHLNQTFLCYITQSTIEKMT